MDDQNKPSPPPSLLRNRNYLLLQGGQIVSYMGTQQQFIALPLLILALTGSAVQAGVAVGLSTIAVLLVSPLAGVLADQWERKQTMILCDLGRLLLTLTIPLAWWADKLTLVQIMAVVTLTGVLGTLFTVANTAAMPTVVLPEQLPAALAQTQAATTTMRTIGSLLGGTLYSIGVTLPFLANSLSFGVSILSLGAIRGRFSQPGQTAGSSVYRAAVEGFRWLWQQPLLRNLTLLGGGDSLRYGAGYLVIVVIAQELGTSPQGIGAIFTGAAVGALLGNLVGVRVRQWLPLGWLGLMREWRVA